MQKRNRFILLFNRRDALCGVSGREWQLCQTLAFIRRNHKEDELIPLPLATLRLVSPGHRGVWQIRVLFLGCPRKERSSSMPFGLSDKSGGRTHHNSSSKGSKKTRYQYMSGDCTAATKKAVLGSAKLGSTVTDGTTIITQGSGSVARQLLKQRISCFPAISHRIFFAVA